MDPKNSFYVAFNNIDSLHYFPDNTSSNFRSFLPTQIPSKNMELALVSISYTDLFTPKEETDQPDSHSHNPTTDSEKKFFDPTKDDNVIHITKVERALRFEITKENNMGVRTFTTTLGQKFVQFSSDAIRMSLLFVITLGAINVEIEIDDPSDEKSKYILLDRTIAKVLGFDKRKLHTGKHVAERELDEAAYDLIEVGEKFDIQVGKDVVSTAIIQEPDEYNIDELISNIALALENENSGIYTEERDNELLIAFRTYTDGTEIKFSRKLNRTLGLAPDHIFDDDIQEWKVPEDLLPSKEEQEKTLIFFQNQLVVHCNLVFPQMFSNKLIPMLRVCKRQKSLKSRVEIDFGSVQYLPLRETHLDFIEILLTDEHMTVLPNSKSPTSVLLHFRKIY